MIIIDKTCFKLGVSNQVFNDTSNEKVLYHRQFTCTCENCVMQNLMFLLEGNINNLFLLPTSDTGKMA